ncbi:ABC transporter permease [Mesorhizobium sp. M2D.F.Ca.ET.185.01.1.1]|uniref:ABC transporter permease n=2 Tax=Mesorhizobium TaxID=68287 RepID=UPI000FCA136D|nr:MULTISPECIES: ABC transporter permease [unclassified Mesorhizobium]TGP45495.1 ABC transporter permease [bacterium M00.F.Ca.ET.230.01.1.1]TGP75665.1 ABC transporter permease [bacterium M00.F.Ca.ET.227.01.1.1]TGP87146.1 ABC transporter permease [bacterium M00.F.Ca.ET.221.01.1.1]TGP91637.1 ABC transporter permease [bacterium M00.F.Ca.ET.222.01.1.1]TGU04108.1 ABC transporter permease [bacterium M00.F.Ca.ET.163.01.1.1]TGU23307.1 ABC transporter permease [bacterium M00.F.Ca.ET.156.01.1.1]TGU443
MRTLKLAIRISLREMRGGLSGFMIFLACIALGVAAIGGVNSVAQAISAGVANQGQTLLGGDLRFQINQRSASNAELGFIRGLGTVSQTSGMRSMARLEDGSDQALVEAKAVDDAYPLYGALETDPALPKEQLFGERSGVFGAAAPDLLFERLNLHIGDRLKLGSAIFELRARLISEPDAVSDGFGFAPRLMISSQGLGATGLVQPGSLVENAYKVRLSDGTSEARIKDIQTQAAKDFPQAGWSIRTRSNAAPALSANIERFSQFLTLIGLTALVVGGVGVANAVRAYLDGKRGVIATFKSLGASGGFVFTVYLVQILLIAGLGIVLGLILAAAMPFVAGALLQSVIPVPAQGGFYPGALAIAALFGLLVTLAFALLPLGRARDVPATALFREMGFESRGLPRLPYAGTALAIVIALAALAILSANDYRIASIFVGATVFAFLVLRLVAVLVQWLASKTPRVRSVPLRLALGNIHRPGALTPSVVLSLGLGLTLLVTLALIDGNLRRQISGSLPERAPNFFFVDIQSSDVDAFASLVGKEAPRGTLVKVPMLRGRIMALNGVDVDKVKIPANGAWVLRGDRGLTYDAKQPENATMTEGTWWPQDYSGEPLVSFSAEEGKAIGLKLGDSVTVNVLGRNVTAKIANFRQVQWETIGINFVMVFSPNSFAGAPHGWLATLTDKQATTADDARLLNAVTRAFPAVTTVRVKDALDIVNRLVAQLGMAIRAAAGVALIASVLVLSGALAAGNRARIHDAVVLKTLGATRQTLIAAFSLEYVLIGLATALFALAAGGIAAWFVVAHIMTLPSHFMPEVAVATILVSLTVTVGIGLAGTWRVLGHKAAPVLRNL